MKQINNACSNKYSDGILFCSRVDSCKNNIQGALRIYKNIAAAPY